MRRLLLLLVPASLVFSCTEPEPEPQVPGEIWSPEKSYRTPELPNERGLLDRRGLIHAHSPHSHDACDGEPILEDGSYDPVCMDDFRRGVAQSRHDFIFLTDHRDSFDDVEFPEAVLFDDARGDEVIDHGEGPVANILGDADRRTLIMGGFEAGTMTVGIDGHVVERESRGDLYGRRDDEALDQLHAGGGIILLQHTEDWSADELANPKVDGFEMYNLHANLFVGLGPALELALRIADGDPGVPHPDAMSLHMISEDERYLQSWATVLSRGIKRITTMGTDCHRNSLPGLTEDGERIDSYRRMMRMFSNHLLVRPDEDGSWDNRHLKEALRAGRLYGAFELMGYPEGFDYVAEKTAGVAEMGDEVSLADAPELVVKRPKILHVDPAAPAPEMTLRILKADGSEWTEVASGDADLRFTPTEPGAYRAEVRMIPHHMGDHLRADAEFLLERFGPSFDGWVWIYANPIYVVE
jgi:hypothetical protein